MSTTHDTEQPPAGPTEPVVRLRYRPFAAEPEELEGLPKIRGILNAAGYDADDEDIMCAYRDWSEFTYEASWMSVEFFTANEVKDLMNYLREPREPSDRSVKMEAALKRIAKWFGEFPETGRFWDEEQKRPMTYSAAFGSNGERDYMRQVAADALG